MQQEIELPKMQKQEIELPKMQNQLEVNAMQARISRLSRLSLLSLRHSLNQSRRRQQKMVYYVLVILMEVITIFISLLLVLLPQSELKWAYLTYIIMTVVRVIVFFMSSVSLIGLCKDLLLLYFLLDNVFVVMVASIITYIFLNYQKQIDFIIPAIVCYPILLFFLCGNMRVMLVFCEWKPWQVVVYKFIKIIGTTYFLVYGCYVIIQDQLANKELFLLWVFTTCTYWAEMGFAVNTKDETDNLGTRYKLMDLDD